MTTKVVSEKRQKLIDDFIKSPFSIGESISVKQSALSTYGDDKKSTSCVVVKVNKKTLVVKPSDKSYGKNETTIPFEAITSRNIRDIGVDPFDPDRDAVRPVAFTLSSIMHTLNLLDDTDRIFPDFEINGVRIKDANWNPFVYDKNGNKQFYQRDYVWTLKDNQALISSIYEGIECGKILVRKRSWKTLEKMQAGGETELSFNDIVDGKQRLNAIRLFIKGEFPDDRGNYYGDLSFAAQNEFVEHQLFSYAEMSDTSTDEDVLKQFLKMNFSGIPQSPEHIEYVRKLREKISKEH